MAVATSSSSAALVKAVALPLMLVLLAVAAGASITEDGPADAKSGGPLSETPAGRKLLALNFCGLGSPPSYSCKLLLPLANNATCCTDLFGTKSCVDVGGFSLTQCGSCTTTCKFGQVCCSGVCTDLLTDKNNCGICGNKCRSLNGCILGLCKYV